MSGAQAMSFDWEYPALFQLPRQSKENFKVAFGMDGSRLFIFLKVFFLVDGDNMQVGH